MTKLIISRNNTRVDEFVVNHNSIAIGRALDNQLVLNEPIISRYHAQISQKAEGFLLIDLDTSHGTYVNGIKLLPFKPQLLVDGDLVNIGSFELKFCRQVAAYSSPASANNPATVLALDTIVTDTDSPALQPLDLRDRNSFSIGRDASNDMSVDHPVVSRFHAKIIRQDGSFYIIDLNSTNGTFVNGKKVKGKRVLMVRDTIRIGPCRLTLNINETLITQNEEGKLGIDVVHLNKLVGKNLNLLNNISLSIPARKFVVIAGVSGGGKSTLLDAINGFRPATSGRVLVNGTDLYQNFDSYRTEIGYVPQKDIVHLELTVQQALNYAAQLRMPADTTRQERRRRVEEVLKDLGLSHRRDVQVKALSGGQLKRVSIGVELLTKPNLFFLDEATSGLDPGTEGEIMRLLRKLADQGRTILLITHATENVTLCDLVVFLAKGGNVAYFGPPQEAPAYFGVSKFNEIYLKVERERSPQEWQQQYLNSPHYQKYVVEPQQFLNIESTAVTTSMPRQKFAGSQVKRISSWRQFLLLSQRNLAILTRDRASLMLMLAIAPILGILDFFTWRNQLFDIRAGDPGQVITMLFTTALIAVMVGSLSTMREIVKEQEIYRRERAIGLQIVPYIFSKIWVSILLALYQAAIFLLFKVLAVDLPSSAEVLSKIYLTLVLGTIAGMVMGLLVSAISPNQNIAPLLTIVFLVPQITFGGGVLPINTFGPSGKVFNQLSLTKWSFESLVTITNLGKDVARDECWNLPEPKRTQLSDEEKEKCKCLGKNIFKTCNFPGIQAKYKPAVDQPEPAKPSEPDDPPAPPQKPIGRSLRAQRQYEQALEQYQKQIDDYQKEMDEYQDKIEAWQEDYSDWRGEYESAIGHAEGTISRFHDNYGSMFDINFLKHWGTLGLLIAVMLNLIVWVQKRKDVI
ncbi:MAG: FHA domain-containing protein [Prochloraceae cyanobacterium]